MSVGDAAAMPPSSLFQLPCTLVTACHVELHGASGAGAAGIDAPTRPPSSWCRTLAMPKSREAWVDRDEWFESGADASAGVEITVRTSKANEEIAQRNVKPAYALLHPGWMGQDYNLS
jgi:hypothetical protein